MLILLSVIVLSLGAQGANSTGSVTVSFTLTRSRQIASDQVAVWIEDAKGTFVKTLFVSSFAGKRAGWKLRPQTLPTWVSASGAKDTPQSDIDAVSGATPSTGPVSVVWDLTDSKGKVVPAGTYRYRIECNITWESTVLWTGTFEVGDARSSSTATAVHSPAAAEKLAAPIKDVSAVYDPEKR